MKSFTFSFDRHPFLNKEANDYLDDADELKPFRDYPPDLDHIPDVIKNRKDFPAGNRKTLARVLHAQYDNIGVEAGHPIRKQIDRLENKDTYTITTGQQIHVALGPMFFIYKILTCIDIADELNRRYPDHHFVPVFWMASEDHDFEEINYVRLYGETYSWNDKQGGPVGRYKTDTLSEMLEQVRERIDHTDTNIAWLDLFSEVYSKHKSLADATQDLIHRLFGDRGLVVLEPDNRELKSEFRPCIENDILHNTSYEPLDQYSRKLKDHGYDLQVNPQDLNHFLLKDGDRIKIRRDNDQFILDSGEKLTADEMAGRIKEKPEDFSPNVVTRPLYQEVILPNLLYIPGGSELRYWLQLKGLFKANTVHFPMFIPRSSAIVISDRTYDQIVALDGELREMFHTENEMAEIRSQRSAGPVKNLRDELNKTRQYFNELPPDLQRLAPQSAPPLKHVGAVEKHIGALLEWLDELPPEVRNNDVSFKKLLKIKRRFFDLAFPQEREEYCINDLPFIEELTSKNSAKGMFTECRNINVYVTKSI